MFDKEEFKRQRVAAGYTQESLATELGITARTVARWERGDTTPPLRKREAAQCLLDVGRAEATKPPGLTAEQDSLLAGTLLASIFFAEARAALRRINSLPTKKEVRGIVREELRRHKVS